MNFDVIIHNYVLRFLRIVIVFSQFNSLLFSSFILTLIRAHKALVRPAISFISSNHSAESVVSLPQFQLINQLEN